MSRHKYSTNTRRHVCRCVLILYFIPYLSQEGQVVELWSCPLSSILPKTLSHQNRNQSQASFLEGSENMNSYQHDQISYRTIFPISSERILE